MKKRIFIYGDSNTWGYIPRGNEDNNIKERYDLSDRWYSTLLDEFECIVDGANGRAIGYDHPVYPNRNALKTINDDLKDVNNIDLAIIYLGTNDFKEEYLATIQDIKKISSFKVSKNTSYPSYLPSLVSSVVKPCAR